MSATTLGPAPSASVDEDKQAKLDRAHTRITNAKPYLDLAALPFVVPILRLIYGDTWQNQRPELLRTLILPVAAILGFIALWQFAYSTMVTVEVRENFWSDERQEMVDREEFRIHALPSPGQTGARWYELL